MSFWVTAYCHKGVASLSAEDLRNGVADRFAALAEQFPGDAPEEETIEAILAVMGRLRVVKNRRMRGFRLHAIEYRDGGPPIILGHMGPRDVPGVIADEVLPGKLARMRRPAARRVRELLAAVTESVSFALKVAHTSGIGFPIALAAAATFVEAAGGVIRSGSGCWMVPAGEYMDIILEYDK